MKGEKKQETSAETFPQNIPDVGIRLMYIRFLRFERGI